MNVASTEGLGATPYLSPYTVSKHGVIGLTRSLACELGPRGVNVNCVCPGPIRTGMTAPSPDGTGISDWSLYVSESRRLGVETKDGEIHDGILAREKAQRQADNARLMCHHAFDCVVGLARIGRSQNGCNAF